MAKAALSEYEEQRLRNISANQEILASLGLDEATLKRGRPEQSRQPRVPQPRQPKTRVSFRHHGLEPDADAEEVDQAMLAAVAGPSLVPQVARGPPRVPRPAVPVLTEAQRGSLAAAQGWISRMKEHYRPMLSDINLRATMQRVEELASGIGVELRGLEVPASDSTLTLPLTLTLTLTRTRTRTQTRTPGPCLRGPGHPHLRRPRRTAAGGQSVRRL